MSKRVTKMWVEFKHTDGKVCVEMDRAKCTDEWWAKWQERIAQAEQAAMLILFPDDAPRPPNGAA